VRSSDRKFSAAHRKKDGSSGTEEPFKLSMRALCFPRKKDVKKIKKSG
jgi:hypothetical protein